MKIVLLALAGTGAYALFESNPKPDLPDVFITVAIACAVIEWWAEAISS